MIYLSCLRPVFQAYVEPTHLIALTLGNPLKIVRATVIPGLKWPPDVAAHTPRAKIMPVAYAIPIWKIAK